jgi:multiple sugar transport system permease protein
MQPYVLTEGGPKDSTYVFMLHIYNQAFRYGRMGYACTLAWIMLVIIMCITLINIGLSRRWVYYSEE